MGRARYSVREEIKDAIEVFYRALSTRNLRTIDGIWAHEPYAAVAGPYGGMHQGWNAVAGFFDERFRQLGDTRIGVRLTDMVYHAVGDVAWVSGTECRTVSDGGETHKEELRVTCVLERRSAGWQLVSYHASQAVEAPAPALPMP